MHFMDVLTSIQSIQSLLCLAAVLDFVVGDPQKFPHPVQFMGWLILRFQAVALRRITLPWGQRWAGVVLGIGMTFGSAVIGGGIVSAAMLLGWEWGLAIATVLLASCFAGRSLRGAAEDVLESLTQGTLESARERLSGYVGRDTATLSEAEIYRAVFETVAENAVDGVLAPLFFASLGGSLGLFLALQFAQNSCFAHRAPLGGPPFWGGLNPSQVAATALSGAVALTFFYKASSTLDSMVGYRTEPYRDLGWFSARLEDKLTWFPCRLAVLSIAALAGLLGWASPMRVLQLCRRDASQDASPNSGWSECVYAAALGVQVGGENYYQGILRRKPYLGDDRQPITPERIQNALLLTRLCFLLWLAIALVILGLEPVICRG